MPEADEVAQMEPRKAVLHVARWQRAVGQLAPRSAAGAAFPLFTGILLFSIHQRLAPLRHVLTMLGGLQALQGVPAALWGDRMAPLSCHPVRHGPCAPPLGPVRRVPRQRLAHLVLLRGREHAGRPPRSGVLPVDHVLGILLVVALGNLRDPRARIPRALSNGGSGGRSSGHRLWARGLVCCSCVVRVLFVCCSVPLFEVLNAQMRREMKMSTHTSIVRVPSRKPNNV